jgi:hypothetical protein
MGDYDINDNGVIQNPGKFEGEYAYVPYFWDAILEGSEDETIDDAGQTVSIVLVSDEDRAEFPQLLNGVYAVALSERDNGFVDCHEFKSEDALDRYRAECEGDDEALGPQEDDIITEDHEKWYQSGRLVLSLAANGQWYAHSRKFPAGQTIGTFEDYRDALQAYMKRTGYSPNCWFISDHGNAHLISFEADR